MAKKILIGLGVVLLGLVAVIALQPSHFKIERSTTINAAPEFAFNVVNDFKQWSEWSPWEKLDPSQKRTFSGAPTGQGSVYEWNGNDKVGSGRMTITKSNPTELIEIKLEFLKPMEQTNITRVSFAPEGANTKVTWSMEGDNGFVGKAFCLVMNMEKMVGPDFERGLASMKEVAEKRAKAKADEDAKKAEEAKKAAEAQAGEVAGGDGVVPPGGKEAPPEAKIAAPAAPAKK